MEVRGEARRPVVVLADDEEAITVHLAPVLERSGFAVHVARDCHRCGMGGHDGDV